MTCLECSFASSDTSGFSPLITRSLHQGKSSLQISSSKWGRRWEWRGCEGNVLGLEIAALCPRTMFVLSSGERPSIVLFLPWFLVFEICTVASNDFDER